MTKLYCILECAIKRHKQKEGVMELGSVCGFKRGYKKRQTTAQLHSSHTLAK